MAAIAARLHSPSNSRLAMAAEAGLGHWDVTSRCYPQASARRQNSLNFPINAMRFGGTTCGDGVVPIKGFLAGRTFDARAINEMSLAFDDACDELGLINSVRDPATSLVAEKIIEVAQRGVRNPDLLRTMALNELGRGPR